ncbi:hypothetical protein NW762_002526 [Fusarium torreyae]|uniref:CCHC-type domain-containing protein n=1 Tax=Fusarium torreyae TaxID=1237075 RepID=A0A9W8SCA1_9HYPO|nr:hypothetical protein NW762_002526 [Fusarium torreyae]
MAPETPRGVSSRLLTMKFMQRAVASETSSPDSETHSAKKRKTGHSPAAGRLDLNIDQAAIKAAIDDQETKRQAALEKHVGADTRWVLDDTFAGTKTTGQTKPPLNIKPEPQKKPDDEDDSEDEDSDEADTPAHGRKRKPSSDSMYSPSRSRSRSRSRPTAESVKAKEFRDKRKKKEVKLSKPASISGGGISGNSQFLPAGGKSMTCYKCHQAGHKAVDCPLKGQSAMMFD